MTATKKPSRTDLMVQAVLEAPENRLAIDYHESEHYERLIRSAKQFRKLPEGKVLRLEKNWRDQEAWIVLEDQPAWQLVVLEPVPVPHQLRNPSEVVTELRNRADFRIRQAEKSRALRLIEALVREARRRGYPVHPTPAPRADHRGRLNIDKDHGHFAISIQGHEYRLTLSQERERVTHVPSKAEEAGGWAPRYDQVVSERLRLTIEGNAVAFHASVWSDKASRPP